MSNIYQSVLAVKLSGLEIAVIACIVILCIALAVVSILLVKAKRNNEKSKEEVTVKQPPIVIYETKRVVVEKTVAAPVKEDTAEVEQVEEVKEEIKEEVVEEIAVAEAAPAVAESDELAMRYNRSFRARLIQSDDEIKEWYGSIKNAAMSYDKVNSRISWKYESFTYKRKPVAKFYIKGKSLYLYLPLNAADYADSKYKLEDVSGVAQFADTPALYKIKSERRSKYAQELIGEICEKLGSKMTDRQPEDYYEPYNSDAVLISKGLVKRVIEKADSSFIGATGFSKAQDADTEFEEK